MEKEKEEIEIESELSSMDIDKDNISWKLIDKYFKNNPTCLVSHHLESYNDFIRSGIRRIFHENNPISFI